ncbi:MULTISPECIES: flagellar brake protein [Lysinibacillus]|uniref:flagellar brake protein n=1 Tax=Lysinibacillus TaxID=400634 RepID=UPI0006CA1549|nr:MULTISPECIES: flagellar brake domain-containing protein [Lysinibacillus]MCT1539752.1 flagellar brake domain-containing protein [Lysinibacillus capsici]MCT1570822.1 flagellar brake domain-containing protein [Lysinibacillus capsici]MCT1648225.1 flagellar brake domain-containing protein [Lysinibacillus capsici]MCT1726767.1 flagellar brake domain-containing protein [Lysinibacillus capsici]MCT1783848.1 flagellar brake domain-containing protein [Lysinibacillus capsici]
MEIKIGTQLQLEPTYTERLEKFRCKVVEQKDNILYIDYPVNMATKKTAFLIDGSEFRATFRTEDKQSFAFNTEVVGRKAGNIPMIMLHCPTPEEFIKIQRREYVRVETQVDVAIQLKDYKYQLVTVDISAGGLAVMLKGQVAFTEGDEVKLTIVLPFANGDVKYVITEALIVRIFEKEDKRIATIQLTDTDDVDQQHIVRFCFERQLVNRRKEMNPFNV